jgi:hypothetical protein
MNIVDQRKRTLYLNEDIDMQMRVVAAKMDKTYSVIVEEAFKVYLDKIDND